MNLVYKYGLLAPTQGADRVRQQMRAAHEYRNRLIELERSRREQLRALDLAAGPDLFARVQECTAAVDAVVDEIRRERGRTRKRSEPADLKQKAKDARAALKAAKAAWFEAVKAARPSAQADRDAANEAFLAARRDARPGLSKNPDGIAAGTYQLVEESVAQSAKSPLWDGGQPSDPRFLRWTGDGFVSQQIVGGATIFEVVGGEHTQVRIGPDESGRPDNRVPGSRRSFLRRRVTLWLRVGSTEDRKPVWACWPMILHRPLPAGAQIQRATVRLRHIGPRAEWSVEFSLRCADPAPKHGDAIAIDIGWRQRRDGTLRIACTHDQNGSETEIVMPGEVASGISFPQGLRATRDLNMEAAKAELARWLGEREKPPLWITEATQSLAQWRSQARLAALVIRWRDNRIDGDAEAFDRLEAWRKQDRHLWLWETSQREGAMRARKDWYRRIAAKLAEQYAVVVLEKFDLRSVARLAPTGQDSAENQTSRANRVVAALSEFRLVLRSAVTQRGGRVVEVDAANTTRTCSVCGVVEDFDAAAMLRHRCANGHEWDQDANAARNIYERFRSAPEPEAARTPDAPTESRRERVARLRAEKVARMDRSKAAPEMAFGTGVR